MGQKGRTANIALAIWRGDKYILSFLFAIGLQFQPTNNAEQQNKQLAFVSLISSGTGQTEHRIPPHRQCFNVVRNPKTTFRSSSSDRTFNAKSFMGDRTLQHICKAHITYRTKTNLAKELQLLTHSKQHSIQGTIQNLTHLLWRHFV